MLVSGDMTSKFKLIHSRSTARLTEQDEGRMVMVCKRK